MYVPTGFDYEFENEEWEEATVIRKHNEYGQAIPETETGEGGYYRVASDASGDDKSLLNAPQDAEMEPSETTVLVDSHVEKTVENVPTSSSVEKPSSQPAKKSASKTTTRAQVLTSPAGLNSIKVHLPLSGDLLAFTKTVVDKHETFPLAFSYISKTLKKTTRNIIIAVVLLGIALVLFKIRHMLKSR